MKKLKVMTIVGTRPEIIKLCRVIDELGKHTDHILVHTGQNHDYELNEIFFKQLNIKKPDHFLNIASENPADAIAKVIASSYKVMLQEKPGAILLLGDTNSCLSVIAAKRLRIPIFHMEAGNRCFDQRVPEEINRKIVDHTSDINLPYTEHARRYLLDEGIRPETIIKTGSPMREVLGFYKKEIESSDVLGRLDLEQGSYFIVSAHREENIDSEQNFTNLLNSLNEIARKYEYPVIFSTHPRTRKKLDAISGNFQSDERIRFLKPLSFFDYVHLQSNAFCVLSDSGTISEESSIMQFPAITIRQAHERPEGMDEGVLIMAGLKPENVLEAINIVTKQYENGDKPTIVDDYTPTNVSLKVVRVIQSYVDYINRTVWHKEPVK